MTPRNTVLCTRSGGGQIPLFKDDQDYCIEEKPGQLRFANGMMTIAQY